MNWSAFWATLSAIIVGGATNELCDLAPWLAKRTLKRAARMEKKSDDEAKMIFEELSLLMDEVPGKLSRLGWSIGRLMYSYRFTMRRTKVNVAYYFLIVRAIIRSDLPVMIAVILVEIGCNIVAFQIATGSWWLSYLGAGGIMTFGLLQGFRRAQDNHYRFLHHLTWLSRNVV